MYPGVGWVVYRSKEYLPEHLVFHTQYLGSDQPSFTLNFSKGASHIIAQYYQVGPDACLQPSNALRKGSSAT